MRTSRTPTRPPKAAQQRSDPRSERGGLAPLLDELEDLLRPLVRRLGDGDAVEEARQRALAASRGAPASALLPAATFVAELVARAAAVFQPPKQEVEDACAIVASRFGMDAAAVAGTAFALATRNERLLLLPPASAVQAELRVLVVFAPVAEASFWLWSPDDPVHAVAAAGSTPPSRASQAAARQAIFGAPARGARASLHPIPVPSSGEPRGALVVRARPPDARRAVALAEELGRALQVILERDLLLERTAAGGRSVVETADRRLRRIGLDLHDGPLQELARLQGDLQVLRHRMLDQEHPPALLPLAREVDAILSLAARLEGGLRNMSLSLGLPPYSRESFIDALEQEVAALELGGVRTAFDVSGEPDSLTESKRIAITRILQEAISNIRTHSGATEVQVALTIDDGNVQLRITDNGAGFEVERVLSRAQRRGRLGLVGIRERARFLGGAFSVDSRPGGPTTVSVTLPDWRPLVRDPEPSGL